MRRILRDKMEIEQWRIWELHGKQAAGRLCIMYLLHACMPEVPMFRLGQSRLVDCVYF